MRSPAALCALTLLACRPPEADSDTDPVADTDSVGPVIEHDPITGPVPADQDVIVTARARDGSGVFDAHLYSRRAEAVEWTHSQMRITGEEAPWVLLEGRIRVADLGPEGMRYYIGVLDASDQLNLACLPEACEADAWYFAVE
jgi:hypothetical protein